MIRNFSEAPDGEKNAFRALQCWQVLISKSDLKSIITYDELSKIIGVFRRGLGPILGHIMYYCQQNNLPPLTCIVVKKGKGKPSYGFTAATPDELDSKRMEVFDYAWFKIIPPTIDELKDAWIIGERK